MGNTYIAGAGVKASTIASQPASLPMGVLPPGRILLSLPSRVSCSPIRSCSQYERAGAKKRNKAEAARRTDG